MTTVRLPLAQPIKSRLANPNKDSRSVNCYFETVGQSRDVIKRPGLLKLTTTGTTIAAGQAQGMYKRDSGNLCVAVNNSIYNISPSLVVTAVGTITSTGDIHNVYFAESANDSYLFLHDGSNGYVSTGTGAFEIIPPGMIYEASVDIGGSGYVTPTCTFSAPSSGVTATGTVNILNGVVQSITITNYGSGYTTQPTCTINPVGGGAGAVISVSLNAFPVGNIVAGAVYIDGYTVVATKQGQIFSSDPDNPKLWNGLNTVAVESDPDYLVGIVRHLNYICAFGEWSTEFFYDAANLIGSPFLRQESYKSEIGCADGNSIVQFQQAVIYVGKSKTHGKSVYMLEGMSPNIISTPYIEKYLNLDSNTKIQSFAFRIAGHTFYVATMPNIDVTFVYDVDQKEWYQWTSYYSADEHNYRLWATTEFYNAVIGLDTSNGYLYKLDTYTYSDNGANIYWRVVTNNVDGSTRFRKFWKSGEIIGDKISGTMSINYSNNDYNTFSSVRTVNLNSSRSIIWQLGQDRYRAYQFLITDDIPIRLSFFEITVTSGELTNDPEIQDNK